MLATPVDSLSDGNANNDLWPYAGDNVMTFRNWGQYVNNDPPRSNHFEADNIVNGLTSTSTTITWRPGMPYYHLIGCLTPNVGLGDTATIRVSIWNDDGPTEGIWATVHSSDTSLFHDFNMSYTGMVNTGDTVTIVSTSPVNFNYLPDRAGTNVYINIETGINYLSTLVHMTLGTEPIWSIRRFSYPVTYNVGLNLVAAGSQDTLNVFDGFGSRLWWRRQSSQGNHRPLAGITIGHVAGTPANSGQVACIGDSNRVSLFSANSGNPVDGWPIQTGRISALGIFNTLVGYVDSTSFYLRDAFGIEHPDTDIEYEATRDLRISAPFVAKHWAWLGSAPVWGDSTAWGGCILLVRDHTTGIGSDIAAMDYRGHLICRFTDPNDQRTLGIPRIADINGGDGMQEAMIPFYDNANHGGWLRIAYSAFYDSIGIGEIITDADGVTPNSLIASKPRPEDFETRDVFSYHSNGNNYVSDDGMIFNLGPAVRTAYLASIDLDNSGNHFIVCAYDNKLKAVGYHSSSTTVLAELTTGDSVVGPTSVVVCPGNISYLLTPVGNATSWTFWAIILPSSSTGADFQGLYGCQENTNRHLWTAPIFSWPDACRQFGVRDTMFMVSRGLDSSSLLVGCYVCSHTNWLIRQFNLYHGPWNGWSGLLRADSVSSGTRHVEMIVPNNTLTNPDFLRFTVTYDTLPHPIRDGSTLWEDRTLHH